MNDRGTFRALRVRNYRIYWSVQFVSQLGTWMRLIGVSWLVLVELDGSATEVGFLAATQFGPTLAFGALAGVLADRREPLRILQRTQVAMALIDAVLVALVVTDRATVGLVFVLVGVAGMVTAVDNPARQAFVSELVPAELVPNAVALNSIGFNGARIIGPAVAGGLIQLGGTALCFGVDAATYLVTLVGLLVLRVSEIQPRDRAPRAPGQVREGIRYASGEPALRAGLLAMAVVGTTAINFTVLVPLLARYFSDTPAAFGILSASMGVGSLIGALGVARRGEPTLRILSLAALGLACSMALVAASPGYVFAAASLAVTGAFVMTYLSTTNSLLQLRSAPAMRGRVMALYLVLVAGTSPIGSPILGAIADQWGVRASVGLGSAGALVGAAIALRGSLWVERAHLAVT